MSYRIAGIDVHKKMLAVVVSDVEVDGEYQFERMRYSSSPEHLRFLAEWLIAQQVEEVVMESTAQYWKPVWGALERYWKPICQEREGAGPKSGTLHLAQAQSNRGRRGRKKDFPDAERLVKRLVANELILSFVPDTEQRLWRTVTRRKYQLTRNQVRLQNQLEGLLEECHIKLSSLVSDLLGASARRMLKALAEGETNPAALAAMADKNLRATQAQLRDALGACTELKPIYRRLLKMFLEELQLIDQQISKLDQELASLLSRHHDAVVHLAEIPGLGVDSAQQIIAEVGAGAATFPSAKQLSSWVGACPGDEESAEVSKSHRSPKGNRHMRRILNQAANAAAKSKGTVFEIVYRRLISRLGHNQTIGAIAHRLCRLIWIILHRGVRYEERGPSVSANSLLALLAVFSTLCGVTLPGSFSLAVVPSRSIGRRWHHRHEPRQTSGLLYRSYECVRRAYNCDKWGQMAKAYRTDVVGKKKFQEEIRQRNALKPERVPCPLAGCECTYEMYGHRPSNPEDNVATLQERLKREHPDHTSEVLAVNEFRKAPR